MVARAMDRSGLLKRIESRFGSRDAAIERAFNEDASFRALCEEYIACVRALARWRESDLEVARVREAEYSTLLAQLTQEIERSVSAMDGTADSGSET